jgi:hypothetical protein
VERAEKSGVGREDALSSKCMFGTIDPIAAMRLPQIHAAVADAVKEFSPDVIHIRYEVKEDWSGDPAIYFRVLVSDEASTARLHEVATELKRRMEERLDFLWLEFFPYYRFRNVSEQAVLQEKSWE